MSETLEKFQTEDVYEPPLLAEVGEYAEMTQGSIGILPDCCYPAGAWW